MPYINLKVAGSLSDEQKKEIAAQFCRTLKEVTGKEPSAAYIVFEEVNRNNWAVGENLLYER